jgi:hypothetical protein
MQYLAAFRDVPKNRHVLSISFLCSRHLKDLNNEGSIPIRSNLLTFAGFSVPTCVPSSCLFRPSFNRLGGSKSLAQASHNLEGRKGSNVVFPRLFCSVELFGLYCFVPSNARGFFYLVSWPLIAFTFPSQCRVCSHVNPSGSFKLPFCFVSDRSFVVPYGLCFASRNDGAASGTDETNQHSFFCFYSCECTSLAVYVVLSRVVILWPYSSVFASKGQDALQAAPADSTEFYFTSIAAHFTAVLQDCDLIRYLVLCSCTHSEAVHSQARPDLCVPFS